MRIAHLMAAGMVALVGLVACSNKAAECKTIVDTIDDDDAALKGIDFKTEDFHKLGPSFKTAADALSKVAADLGSKKFTNADIVKESSDYQAFAKELGGELTQLATICDTLAATQDKLPQMQKDSVEGINKINKLCETKAGSADCQAIHNAWKDKPDPDAYKFDADLKEDAAAIKKFADEMGALPIKDADLKAAVDEFVKGAHTRAEILTTASETIPKIDAAQKQFLTTAAKEEPIVRHINETCGGG